MDENLPPVFRTSENNTWKASLQKKENNAWADTVARDYCLPSFLYLLWLNFPNNQSTATVDDERIQKYIRV